MLGTMWNRGQDGGKGDRQPLASRCSQLVLKDIPKVINGEQ